MLTSLQALLRLATLRRLGVFICALATLLAATSTASAIDPAQTKTRVWGFDFAEHNSSGLFRAASSGKHLGNRLAGAEEASGSLLAAEGALNSVPLLARASGREMLGEALNVLKATPAGERGALASELMAQVQARAVGGAWQATEMAGANGARAFVGEYHTLVVDAAGNVFKGANAGVTYGVVNGAPGVASWAGLAQVF